MDPSPGKAATLNFASFPTGNSRIAFHEAGHIIAALHFCGYIDTVRISGDYITRSRTGRTLSDTERNVIDIAGWVSEVTYLNVPEPWEGQWYDAFDRAREGLHGFCDECRIASHLVSARPNASSGELLIAVRCIAGITRRLLRSHWESVKHIAHALLAVGWLDDAECRGLVGGDPIEDPAGQWVRACRKL
jgi:hypothetical protein